jgi:hypothetical protein
MAAADKGLSLPLPSKIIHVQRAMPKKSFAQAL